MVCGGGRLDEQTWLTTNQEPEVRPGHSRSGSDNRPLAVIDIGSNTVRLLVALAVDGKLLTLTDQSRFVRLGRGVDASGNLSPDRQQAALVAVRELAAVAQGYGARSMVAIATSAVRDAANGPEFVSNLRREAGIAARILTGEEEARLTFLGASAGIEIRQVALVCDLGGGSTELVAAREQEVLWGRSLQLGSGRLTELFVHSDPPAEKERRAIRRHVLEALRQLPRVRPEILILTGGTATHAALLSGLESGAGELRADALQQVEERLYTTPSSTVATEAGFGHERAQVLPAGVTALCTMQNHFQPSSSVVTRRGLREGAILDELSRSA